MFKKIYLTGFALSALLVAKAQNTFPATGAVGIGTTSPNASALLDITSTTKGMLAPRMTKVQRDAIASPATGLLIYQTNSTPGFYFYNGSAWTQVATGAGGANKTLSNLTAPTAINQSIIPGSGTFLGLGSGTNQWGSLYLKGRIYAYDDVHVFFTDPDWNTSVGRSALTHVWGMRNTAIGHEALKSNSFGNSNTAVGAFALWSQVDAGLNTAIGDYALHDNYSGSYNTAVGAYTLRLNDVGENNIAFGYNALSKNTSGNSNIGIGVESNGTNTGTSTLAIGTRALWLNTSASNLIAIGDSSLYNNTGAQNTGIGSKVAYSGTTGAANTSLGFQSAYYNTLSSFGTSIGNKAGWNVNNGNYCTYIGANAGPTVSGFVNTTGIGYNVTPTASNQVRIGDANVTSIGGQVSWSTLSDGRFKKNIKENVPGLSFINKLKAVTYSLDLTAFAKSVGEDRKNTNTANETDRKLQEKIIHTGFIAQDVEAVAKNLNYEFDGVDAPKNDKDHYSLRYAEFVVPLVKAVQELSQQNDSLKNQLAVIMQKMAAIETALQNGNSSIQSATSSQVVKLNTAALLEQNTPNPFSNNTVIKYNVPATANNATLIVTDANGRNIKTITINNKGAGQITLQAGTLAAGTYQYTLLTDGKIADTKKMLIVK